MTSFHFNNNNSSELKDENLSIINTTNTTYSSTSSTSEYYNLSTTFASPIYNIGSSNISLGNFYYYKEILICSNFFLKKLIL